MVLSGGVARGLAHIGVLKVIDKYKIPVDYLAATSSGSIIGAVYASGMEVRLIEEIGMRIRWGKILRLAFFKPGFVSGEGIEDLIIKYIGDLKFSDLKIPFSTVATDLKSGQAVVIDQGKVAQAVAASAAFPGLFAPVSIGHHFLVDGSICNNVPIDVAKKMGANFTIASDVVPAKPIHFLPGDAFQAFSRSIDIVLHNISAQQRGQADILIEPKLDEDIYPFDLHKVKRLIAAGEAAAHQALRHLGRSFQ